MYGKQIDQEIAEEYLRDIDPMWKAYWFHMHLVAKNLEEFAEGMKGISDEVFAYHVSGQKNDFAKWVQEVVGDSVLARALTHIVTKEEAAKVTAERVAELKEALASAA